MRPFPLALPWAFLVCFLGVATVGAQNDGQSDLDQATDLQLKAKTLADNEKVISLCESALNKGLDETNTQFAKQLLVSALWQRASQLSSAILERTRGRASTRAGNRCGKWR